MESSGSEQPYKKWIISMMAVILVLLVICTGLLTVLLLQGEKSDSSTVSTDSLLRKPRGIRDMWNKVVDTVKETVEGIKAEFLAHDVCIIKDETDDEAAAQPVCITKHCTETAALLISAMDKSADPCEDFYKFSCGGFIKKNPVPKDETFVSTSLTYLNYYKLLLKNLLEETDYTKEPNIVFRMQEAYHVCVNTTYQPKEETEGFKRFLQNQLNGWPNVDVQNHSVEEFMGQLIRKGYEIPFIKVSLNSDSFNDPRKFVLQISENFKPSMVVDTLKIKNRTICNLLSKSNVLEKIGKAVGYNHSCFRDKNEIKQMNVYHSFLQVYTGSQPVKYMTIGELINVTESKFDWITLFNTVFDGFYSFTVNDHIFVSSEKYFETFAKLTESKLNSSSLSHYIHDVIVQDVAIHGGPEISKYLYDYLIENNKEFQIPSRDDICLEWIMEVYPMVLTRLVVRQYLNPKTKEAATKMVDLIVKAYEDTIKNSAWVDKATKERAITKARSLVKQIAYPEFVVDDEKIEEEFSKLPQVYSTHIENFAAAKRFEQDESFKLITREFDPASDWLSTPLTINAGYSPEFNTVVMQLGMLNLPFFDVNRVAAVNYGLVGSVIGHEIGHGFDTSGRLYDEIGRKTKWWTNSTEHKYLKLAQCYVDQYSSYCPEELSGDNVCVKGEQTVGENIADNSGLKAAYQAYLSYIEEYGEEKRLPGLQEYTPEQIFFLSFAYAWCENIPAYNWVRRYSDDEHASGKYRVLGALSNSEDFAKVFNCPPGPMNRDKERCTLW